MDKKYVKDRAHNRYPAYCCDDIDARVGKLEEDVAALVAGTVTDGSVTLPKLADDARTYVRELNKGTLIAEWIGTEAEYQEHLAAHAYEPLPNVKYTITDKPSFAQLTGYGMPVGSLVTVALLSYDEGATKTRFTVGELVDCSDTSKHLYKIGDGSEWYTYGYGAIELNRLKGTWRCIGYCGDGTDPLDENLPQRMYLFQRVK
jgi:hypothetical protein